MSTCSGSTLVHGLFLAVAITGCGGGSGSAAPNLNSSPSVTVAPAPEPAPAAGTEDIKVEIQTDASGVIRNDIGRHTFGTGIEFGTSQLRWTMEQLHDASQPPVSTKTRDAFKSLQLGTLRFPTGNASFAYFAENPQGSYLPGRRAPEQRTQWDLFLTPDEITRYTDSAPDRLDMERMFEVNSVVWLNDSGANGRWEFRYLDDTFNAVKGCASTLPPLCTQDLAVAATKAAQWVARDQGKTKWWEVGNEDWSRLTDAQHAEVFYVFQEKMKAVRPDIQLLAQGLAENYNANTPRDWFNSLKKRLADNGKLDSVYAYSIHQFLGTELYASDSLEVRRSKQTQNMLADVAEGKPVNDVKLLLGTDSTTSPTRNWKIWMTEFNVGQRTGVKDEQGQDTVATLQDMGHGLVIADWTGKLLEQNVERLFLHSLDHHPAFALVQYQNLGADMEHPRVTVPGFAYAMYAQKFGKTMVRNTIAGNPTLTAPNSKSYPQIAVYSSISADSQSLRVVVINRHLKDEARLSINTRHSPGGRVLADGNYSAQQLASTHITDTNAAAEQVKWSATGTFPQKETGLDDVMVAPASVTLFSLPLR